jgi:hypothetical protein
VSGREIKYFISLPLDSDESIVLAAYAVDKDDIFLKHGAIGLV